MTLRKNGLLVAVLFAALAGLAAIPLAPFGRGIYHLVNNPYNDRHFDRQTWRKAGMDRSNNPRLRMTDDLLKRHLKPGMTRKQVRALLGAPDASSEADRQQNRDRYEIGYLVLDPVWIAIQYDGTGSVIDMGIEQG